MVIQGDPKVSVIKEADDGMDLLEQLNYFISDILILEKCLPALSGLEGAKIIKGLYPEIKLVIMTNDLNSNYFYEASKIGVHGYVLKNEIERIPSVIDNVMKGNPYVSPYFK